MTQTIDAEMEMMLLFPGRHWVERTGAEYMLRINGDCMSPAGIRDGAHVGFKRQTTADHGEFVHMVTHDGADGFRIFTQIDGRDCFVSADGKDTVVYADDADIAGLMVGYINWI